jgi:hypothetical protein
VSDGVGGGYWLMIVFSWMLDRLFLRWASGALDADAISGQHHRIG